MILINVCILRDYPLNETGKYTFAFLVMTLVASYMMRISCGDICGGIFFRIQVSIAI